VCVFKKDGSTQIRNVDPVPFSANCVTYEGYVWSDEQRRVVVMAEQRQRQTAAAASARDAQEQARAQSAQQRQWALWEARTSGRSEAELARELDKGHTTVEEERQEHLKRTTKDTRR
jgi:DNA-binding NarL/FixJ family response regulator